MSTPTSRSFANEVEAVRREYDEALRTARAQHIPQVTRSYPWGLQARAKMGQLLQRYLDDANIPEETSMLKIIRMTKSASILADILFETNSHLTREPAMLSSLHLTKQDREYVIPQARLLLAFRRLVMWRHPKAILYVPPKVSPPEALENIPEILSVVGLVSNLAASVVYPHLRERIADLLVACYDPVVRSPEGWCRAPSILRFANEILVDIFENTLYSYADREMSRFDFGYMRGGNRRRGGYYHGDEYIESESEEEDIEPFLIPTEEAVKALFPSEESLPVDTFYNCQVRVTAWIPLSRLYYLYISFLTHAQLPASGSLSISLDFDLRIADHVATWTDFIVDLIFEHSDEDGKFVCDDCSNEFLAGMDANGQALLTILDEGLGATRCVGELLLRKFKDEGDPAFLASYPEPTALDDATYSLARHYVSPLTAYLDLIRLDNGPIRINDDACLTSHRSLKVASLQGQLLVLLVDFMQVVLRSDSVFSLAQQAFLHSVKALIPKCKEDRGPNVKLSNARHDMTIVLSTIYDLLTICDPKAEGYRIPYSVISQIREPSLRHRFHALRLFAPHRFHHSKPKDTSLGNQQPPLKRIRLLSVSNPTDSQPVPDSGSPDQTESVQSALHPLLQTPQYQIFSKTMDTLKVGLVNESSLSNDSLILPASLIFPNKNVIEESLNSFLDGLDKNELTEIDLGKWIEKLGRVVCLCCGTQSGADINKLTSQSEENAQDVDNKSGLEERPSECSVCDHDHVATASHDHKWRDRPGAGGLQGLLALQLDRQYLSTVLSVLKCLIERPRLAKTSIPRIAATMVLGRVSRHIRQIIRIIQHVQLLEKHTFFPEQGPEGTIGGEFSELQPIQTCDLLTIADCSKLLDLSTMSVFGQFILKSLYSSIRELRIASVRALGGFVFQELGNIRASNREFVEEYLVMIVDRVEKPRQQEAQKGGGVPGAEVGDVSMSDADRERRKDKVGAGILEAVVGSWGVLARAYRAELESFNEMVSVTNGRGHGRSAVAGHLSKESPEFPIETEEDDDMGILTLSLTEDTAVAAEQGLVSALVRLLFFLGSENPYVRSIASIELQLTANFQIHPSSAEAYNSALTPGLPTDSINAFFRPFLSHIMPCVAAQHETNPTIIQQMGSLMGRSADELFLLSQFDTVPGLVAAGKVGVLERIAYARSRATGTPTTVRDVCLRPSRVLGAVLGEALVQCVGEAMAASTEAVITIDGNSNTKSVGDSDRAGSDSAFSFAGIPSAVMDRFAAVAPEFKSLTLTEIVKIEYSAAACELLKRVASPGSVSGKLPTLASSTPQAALQSIALLATVFTDRKPSPLPSPRISRAIVEFFSDHILGIVTPFSHILGSSSDAYSLSSKQQALRAIGEMVRLAGGRVGVAIPQIRASIEAAIAIGLVDGGVDVWLNMVRQSKGDTEGPGPVDIPSLVDHTFALVAECWDRLSVACGQRVCDLLAYLSHSHTRILQTRAPLLSRLPETPLLAKFSSDLSKYAADRDPQSQLHDFTTRCADENGIVVQRGLIELVEWLEQTSNAGWIQAAVITGPVAPIEKLYRALLDAPFRFSGYRRQSIVSLCATALGLIGAVDGSRVEAMRVKKEIIVVSNFENFTECVEFVASLLGTVLVAAFRSTSNARAQNYLAFTMQELMRWCGFHEAVGGRSTQTNNAVMQVWLSMAEGVRTTLAPYLNSRFFLQSPTTSSRPVPYPVFNSNMTYLIWLRTVTRDLLRRAKGPNAEGIFAIISRVIRWQDASIAGFMLPFAVLHVVVSGSDKDRADVMTELRAVLQFSYREKEGSVDGVQGEEIRMCGGEVFRILDYLSRWRLERERELHSKEKERHRSKDKNKNVVGGQSEEDEGIKRVSSVLSSISAELISTRAMQWGAHARALFHWEQFEREKQEKARKEKDKSGASEATGNKVAGSQDDYFRRLQQIYASIAEPDCIEGISAHLHVLSPEQRLLEDKEAGRWSAVQSWCEQELVKRPTDVGVRLELLGALRGGGRYGMLLARARAFLAEGQRNENGDKGGSNPILPFAVEAAWAMGEWNVLEELVGKHDRRSCVRVARNEQTGHLWHSASGDKLDPTGIYGERALAGVTVTPEDGSCFNVIIGRALLALRDGDQAYILATVHRLREAIAQSLSFSGTVSLQTCSDQLFRLHVLQEIEMISQTRPLNMELKRGSGNQPGLSIPIQVSSSSDSTKNDILKTLTSRLSIIPISQQLPLLLLRMATLSAAGHPPPSIASVLLQAARFARKSGMAETGYEMVLRAMDLDEEQAVVEQAKGMWQRSTVSAHGEAGTGTGAGARRAMKTLEAGIERMMLAKNPAENPAEDASGAVANTTSESAPNMSNVPATASRFTAADYARGRAVLLLAKWMDQSGSTRSDAVINQYRRANEMYGRWEKGHYHLGRYYNNLLESEKLLPPAQQSQAFQSSDHARLVISNYLKSVMFGAKHAFETIPRILTLWLDLAAEVERVVGKSEYAAKSATLEKINEFILKYISRTSAYMYYTALTQLLSRLGMANKDVTKAVNVILMRIIVSYPRQSLWSVLAVAKSSVIPKAQHAKTLLDLIKNKRRVKPTGSGMTDVDLDLSRMITQSARLTEGLVRACDAVIEPRITAASLSRHLFFDHSLAPSFLVVPIESALTPTLPTAVGAEEMKRHEPFARSVVTISSFEDHVLVLNSLQRPRKITLRGSDGRSYSLLCKPRDDLRLDQRTMEFNGIINRALKQDPDSSRRRLSIKTNAVTPLNEECGAIEWIEGIKPLRDILLRLYTRKGLKFDFMAIKALLDEASSAPEKHHQFTTKLLPMFPPILHEFFTESFPEPESWFAARMRYTRSMAVMSIVGHVIGLGDRHGENILLHEPSGTVVHVDFNCLFDKGLTFEKPELVPFRLTHNMVDACGPYGIEGPFRRSAEITTSLLRSHEEALLTVLETFVHDPTAGFIGRRRRKVAGVPHTPTEVLESVRNKVRGRMKGEAVPFGVEGWVEALIAMAREESNLVAMYIGWCAFL